MEYLNKNKTIIVRSSPDNSDYKQLKNALENPAIVNGLKKRNLDIVQDTSANNGFNFYLYGQDGSLFLSENNYSEGTFDNLFKFVDGMTPKPSTQSGGGKVDYRHKYYKYKAKCDELKSIITSFNTQA